MSGKILAIFQTQKRRGRVCLKQKNSKLRGRSEQAWGKESVVVGFEVLVGWRCVLFTYVLGLWGGVGACLEMDWGKGKGWLHSYR
jgi:hypothetical protein